MDARLGPWRDAALPRAVCPSLKPDRWPTRGQPRHRLVMPSPERVSLAAASWSQAAPAVPSAAQPPDTLQHPAAVPYSIGCCSGNPLQLDEGTAVELADLARTITPESTVLLLGAGASVPSGAPTGAALARHLASKLSPAPDGDDLAEIAGIFEHRLGRAELAKAVRARLSGLQPTRGLLALPAFDWRAIYSTNFDRLVEESYKIAARDLHVVRSNYEFSQPRGTDSVLYKIHGCITQDVGLGHHARMVLTELRLRRSATVPAGPLQ